jgi:EpsI family protein
VLLAVAAGLSFVVPSWAEVAPPRSWFVDFPKSVGEWEGRPGRIEDQYLDVLKLDDYLMIDYARGRELVNFYVAYYASQRQGESVHSPRACIPGGGWRITDFSEIEIPLGDAGSLPTNRAVIQLGEERQLVYYWFKQRERLLTDEYLVKWYVFFDSLTRHRTDGALVRLITPLTPGEPIASADKRLQDFARDTDSILTAYVPN